MIDLSEREADGVTVLRVEGEVDLSTSPRLRAALERIGREGSGPIVVDLTACTYIDSTGLAALLQGAGRSGDFAVVAGDGAPREVLEVTKLDEIVPLYATLAEARAASAAETR